MALLAPHMEGRRASIGIPNSHFLAYPFKAHVRNQPTIRQRCPRHWFPYSSNPAFLFVCQNLSLTRSRCLISPFKNPHSFRTDSKDPGSFNPPRFPERLSSNHRKVLKCSNIPVPVSWDPFSVLPRGWTSASHHLLDQRRGDCGDDIFPAELWTLCLHWQRQWSV